MVQTCSIAHPAASTHPARPPAGATGPDGADLVRLAQQGDTAAFGALYEQYAPAIARYLRRRLGASEEVLEDLTSELFVKVYQKLGGYQDRGLPFSAWLYRIAHNLLVDHVRALPRHAARSLDAADNVPERTTGRALGRVLDRQVLAPALARLTDEQRRAVELRFLEGRSVAETAALLGRTEEAVKKLQARGLANLRRLLEPAVPAPPVTAVGRAASVVA